MSTTPAPQRPNLLLITTDQQRFDTIHAAGNPNIYTPHLNWLMNTGVRFTRSYCDAPHCVPSRATMLTGCPLYQNPQGHKIFGSPTAPNPARTLPGLLTSAGYQTRAIGKMHYHPERCNYGHEHMETLEDYYRHRAKIGGKQPLQHGLMANEMEPAISTVHETESLTHWTAERAIDFLETKDPTRPFYLNLSFSKPHPPFDPPFNYWSLYQDHPMPPPIEGEWSRDTAKIPSGFMVPTWNLNGADRFSPAQWTAIKRAYYACITHIDYTLGLLFARMQELGLLNNTLIVFTSDHGEMLGDHHMGAKGTFLEGSAHVPLLVRPPTAIPGYEDIVAGETCDALTTHADLLPTFLAAAGVERPADLPGNGFDLIATHRGKVRRECLYGAFSVQFGIIEGDYKYLFTSEGGGELLFNLRTDPRETRDLIAVEPEIANRLRRKLAVELAAHGHDVADAESGTLRTVKPAVTAQGVRQKPWPGFHTTKGPIFEVLH